MPDSAPTGTTASGFNCHAAKDANVGEWLFFYDGQQPMARGEYLLLKSCTPPTDNHDATDVRLGELSTGPNLQVNILGYNSNVGFGNPGWVKVDDTPACIWIYRIPRVK